VVNTIHALHSGTSRYGTACRHRAGTRGGQKANARRAITYGQDTDTPVAWAACRSFDPAHQEVIMNRIHRWLADHGR
jgi:hypothetical protein